MTEEWRDIPDYEGLYQASNQGRIKRYHGGVWYEVKQTVSTKRGNYLRVRLWKDGKGKDYRVHRLVWEVFNGPIPDGLHVNHINENVQDNRLTNLNLMTPKENNAWGTGKERRASARHKAVLQYDQEGNLVREWPSVKSIEEETGWNRGFIANCCRGLDHYNTAHGFVWRYAE